MKPRLTTAFCSFFTASSFKSTPIVSTSSRRDIELIHCIMSRNVAHVTPGTTTESSSCSYSTLGSTTDLNKIRSEKQALRRQIRNLLKELPHSTIQEESHQVWDRVCSLSVYQRASTVGLFLSMPTGELQTHEMVQRILDDDKIIYVPKVGCNFENPDMELIACRPLTRNADFYKSWPTNKWSIPEPPTGSSSSAQGVVLGSNGELVTAMPGDLDIIIVPGLAFDAHGGRLGQGKGYYDRFLAKICSTETSRPTLIAVGLQCQFVENTAIPMNDYDFRMDVIVLPDRTVQVTDLSTE